MQQTIFSLRKPIKYFYFLLLVVIFPYQVFSDIGPLQAHIGNVVMVSNKDIILENEVINLHLFKDHFDVEVIYHFFNTGKEQNIIVGFPAAYGSGFSSYELITNYHIYDYDKEVKVYISGDTNAYEIIKNAKNPAYNGEIDHTYECSKLFFKENEKKLIRNTYSQKYQYVYGNPLRISANYILNTGSFWKDNIKSIDVNAYFDDNTLDGFQDRYEYFNLKEGSEGIHFKNALEVFPTNYQIENNIVKLHLENIKPDFDIKIVLPRYLYSDLSESSELKDDKYNYSVSNVINDDPNSTWVAGGRKDGINENITLFVGNQLNIAFNKTFQKTFTPILIDKIGIINGLSANSNLFYENNRVKKIKITHNYPKVNGYLNTMYFESKEVSEVYDLKDIMEMQYIEFKKPVLASYLKFTILDIYMGTKYPHDTCISKIRVITEKTNGFSMSHWQQDSDRKWIYIINK